MKYFLSAAILAVSFSCLTALHAKAQTEVQWVGSLDEALRLAQQNKRKILIDVYTGWCGWCKVMDQRTYHNPKVANYISQKYYAVRIDAETKDTLHFQGHDYLYLPDMRLNQLAYVLLSGQMSYPTTLFMTDKAEIITPIKGYVEAPTMLKLLHFIGDDDMYLKMKWAEYEKNYFPE